MYSYRSEVYTSPVSQLFLKTYVKYYQVKIKNKITSYYDNKAYVERLTNFLAVYYLTRGLLKKRARGLSNNATNPDTTLQNNIYPWTPR